MLAEDIEELWREHHAVDNSVRSEVRSMNDSRFALIVGVGVIAALLFALGAVLATGSDGAQRRDLHRDGVLEGG